MEIELNTYRKAIGSGRFMERKVISVDLETKTIVFMNMRTGFHACVSFRDFKRWMKGATTCPTPQ